MEKGVSIYCTVFEEGGGEQSRVPEAREGKPLEGASTIYCVGSEVSHPPLVAVMRVQYLKKVIITSNTNGDR